MPLTNLDLNPITLRLAIQAVQTMHSLNSRNFVYTDAGNQKDSQFPRIPHLAFTP